MAFTHTFCLPGWWKSKPKKKFIRASIGLVVVVLIIVLIQVFVPTTNRAVNLVVRQGLSYFFAMFFVSGIMPILSTLVGLAESEALPNPESIELKRKRSKKRFTRDDLFLTPVDSLIAKDQTVIEVTSDSMVPDVLKLLFEKNIYSAPVWDTKDGSYVGFIDMVDIVKSVVELFEETEMLGEDFSEFITENYEKKFASKNASAVTG